MGENGIFASNLKLISSNNFTFFNRLGNNYNFNRFYSIDNATKRYKENPRKV